ncbi:hypothetical protein CEXT_779361 [Caerostris extrusa]|uniref:Uncharacterized protein n=1 Tax=Caerostris extrusa TaxID=172846 RepID=A0AAV4NFZ3_CAEEX|nr:hypothetical protein CEXT_779361 [Caerostris extrusa]
MLSFLPEFHRPFVSGQKNSRPVNSIRGTTLSSRGQFHNVLFRPATKSVQMASMSPATAALPPGYQAGQFHDVLFRPAQSPVQMASMTPVTAAVLCNSFN